MSSREGPSLIQMAWGNQGGFTGEMAFIHSFNKHLIPCSASGPVRGPGESSEWKVSDGLTAARWQGRPA